MEGSRLLSVDSDKETAKKARGRPDTSLWKVKDGKRERLLVIECKFSDSPLPHGGQVQGPGKNI
jgi:hypothetical protein